MPHFESAQDQISSSISQLDFTPLKWLVHLNSPKTKKQKKQDKKKTFTLVLPNSIICFCFSWSRWTRWKMGTLLAKTNLVKKSSLKNGSTVTQLNWTNTSHVCYLPVKTAVSFELINCWVITFTLRIKCLQTFRSHSVFPVLIYSNLTTA